MSLAFSKILAGMLVKYSDVQNSIVAKMNALSRKHATDKESVRLWMEELRQNRFYSAMYEVSQDPKGPFIVSWISPWRKMVYFYMFFYILITSTNNLLNYISSKLLKSGTSTLLIRRVSLFSIQRRIAICSRLLFVTR